MNARGALTAYFVAGVSAAVYSGLPALFVNPFFLDRGVDPNLTQLYLASTAIAIFGMVLAPYFGVAALLPGSTSVWVQASGLIHRHISIPFLGGVSLFFFRFYFGSGLFSPNGSATVLVVYGAFVVLGSLITAMAGRAAAPVN